MTGRLSNVVRTLTRTGPQPVTPLPLPAPPAACSGGCCPHPRLSWGPCVPEEPGHAHGPRLPPRRPAVPSPSLCHQPPPHSVPRAAAARPKIKAGQGGTQGSEQEGAPRPRGQQGSQLLGSGPRSGGPGPWAAGSGQALCRRRGQSRAPAVASSEQRWGSCLFLPGGGLA